ncbi:MAG TPA: hypothetical protein VLU43_02450 [Anaeromyxobacteraceae bacterium]|nr:hypothetical protein [Anaeromyxobacteraceae bacterium]
MVALACILSPLLVAADVVDGATEAEPSGGDGLFPDRVSCRTGPFTINVNHDGPIAIKKNGGGEVTTSLELARGATQVSIVKVWCASAGGDVILIYRASYYGPSGEWIGGGVARLQASTGRTKWTAEVGGNAGPPLVEARYAYVGGLGVIGKIDLDSGAYVWRHS